MGSPQRMDNTPYLPTGDPLTSVETSKFRSGEFGHVYLDYKGQRWQNVKAGAVFTHAPAVTEIWYWAAGHGFLADTDFTDSEAGVNSPAGILPTGATVPLVSQFFWLLQEGPSVIVSGVTGVNFLANGNIIASTTVGQVTATASGTAPLSQPIGTVHTPIDHTGGAGPVVIDLNIPSRLF